MSPSDLPGLPPPVPAPAHPAPPSGWRPLSGLAITSFVLALVLALVAMFGLWWVELVPVALGVLVLVTVRSEARRGRGLAVAAIAIGVPVALLAYQSHNQLRDRMRDLASNVLAALRADDVEKLRPWIDADALKDGAADRLRERYTATVAAVGPYVGPVEAGSTWLGILPMAMRPAGAKEVGAASGAHESALPAGTLWVRARFEKGEVYVALVLKGGGADSLLQASDLLQSKGAAAVLSDLRFFRIGD